MLSRAEILLIRSLSDRKVRMENGLFVAEGRKLVSESLRSGLTVRKVYTISEESSFPDATLISPKEMGRISNMRSPQGVLALIELPRRELPLNPGGKLSLVLDCIQDPGNLGTMIRLCDWFGIRDIFCSQDTVDCYNPKVVQATMGALFRVAVHYTDLKNILAKAADGRNPVYGAFLDGENLYSGGIPKEDRGMIVMGNEGNGISPELTPLIDRKIFIPPFPAGAPGSESLNVSTAAAVIISEFRRGSRP